MEICVLSPSANRCAEEHTPGHKQKWHFSHLAVFLLTHPELKDKIDGIAMMGGAVYAVYTFVFGGASLQSVTATETISA